MHKNKIIKRIHLPLIAMMLLTAACTKEKKAIYEVNEVTVKPDNNPKQRTKTTIEFISIAYQDIFGTTVPAQKLNSLAVAYTAFGDKKAIEDMIIKNFINEPNTLIPSKASMTSDVSKFVKDTFRKIYNRDATEYELYYFTQMINNTADITPQVIYYALMTSEEYRYY